MTKNLTVLFTLLFTSLSYANTQTSSIKVESKKAITKNSKENRENIKYQFTVGAGVKYSSNAENYNLSYFEKPNLRYGLQFSKLSNYGGDNRGNALSINRTEFKGNSYYTKIEASLTKRIYTDRYYWNKPEGLELAYTKDETVTYASFGYIIGNQWQWKNFTIGTDWVGIHANLNDKRKNENSNVKFILSLLNFSVGASF